MFKPIFLLTILALSFPLKAQNALTLNLKANKLVFDAKRNKIYATVNGLDVAYGNSLVKIDPVSGVIESSVYVGSEPTEMSMTKDTNFLYIALNGASFIKRVSLNTFLVDKTISLGSGANGALFAQDIATVKLSPDIIVVALKYTSISPAHAGVAAFFKGVKLPSQTPGHTGSNQIESANDTNFVVGFNTESTESGVRKMNVDSVMGVTLLNVTTNIPMGYYIKFHNNLIYSSAGIVLDPFSSPPSIVGTCQFGGSFPYAFKAVEPDHLNNRIFFFSAENPLTIRSHNLQTYAFSSSYTYTNIIPANFQSPQAIDIIRYNTKGLAVIFGENYFTNLERRVVLFNSFVDVGLNEYNSSKSIIGIWPNPTNSKIQICGTDFVYLEVSDMFGKILYTQKINSESDLILNVEEMMLSPGLYTVLAKNKHNSQSVGKFIYTR